MQISKYLSRSPIHSPTGHENFDMVWPWFFCGTVFVCLQSPYRGNDMIFWIFPVVLCHAFCMWHWPICKNLDLSFVWGHHHLRHLVDDQSINRLLHYLLHRADKTPTRSKQLSTVAILDFQFGLYHVVAPLTFFTWYQPCISRRWLRSSGTYLKWCVSSKTISGEIANVSIDSCCHNARTCHIGLEIWNF